MKKLNGFSFKMNIEKSNYDRCMDVVGALLQGGSICGTYFHEPRTIEIYLNETYKCTKSGIKIFGKKYFINQNILEKDIVNVIEHEAIHHALKDIIPKENNEDSVAFIQNTIRGKK